MLDPRLAPVSSGSGLENRPTVLDLFSAPGGMSQGFRDAGFKVLAVVDIDSWGCETLRQNFSLSGTEIIETDVQRLGITGRVDVVTGGPPCQSFSQVGRAKINHLTNQGKRERFIDDERNRMYKEFVRVVASLKPQFFVMENVPGISSFRDGQVVEDILADFEGIGYSVDVEVLKAADYGIPISFQRRFSLVIRTPVKVACRKTCESEGTLPFMMQSPTFLRSRLEKARMRSLTPRHH